MVDLRCGRGGCVQLCLIVLVQALLSLTLRADPLDSPRAEETAPQDAAPHTPVAIHAPVAIQTPAPLWGGDIWRRPQLSGDWFGARPKLAEGGVIFFGDITQYYQGVAAGGLRQQFEYGGRGDYLVDFDSQKLGLWDGGHVDLRGESRLGRDVNDLDGAVALSNFGLALPQRNQNITALTGVQYTQDVSEHLSVFFGKLNLLDGTPAAYARGMRLNYFMNAAMQSNLSRSYLIPSTLGAGFTIRDDVEPVFNFYLLDTRFTPATSGFETLFANGVVAYGEYRKRTNWFGLPGHGAVGFLHSTATRTAIDTDPFLALGAIQAGDPLPTKDSAWTITGRFDQVVYADPDDSRRTWTVNSDVGLTDGNPNPIRWFANFSLVAGGLIRGREEDAVGIGYYHLGASSVPFLKLHGLGGEDGVELFYNAAITPAFHVTPDVQIIDPSQRKNSTVLLFGIRARLSF